MGDLNAELSRLQRLLRARENQPGWAQNVVQLKKRIAELEPKPKAPANG